MKVESRKSKVESRIVVAISNRHTIRYLLFTIHCILFILFSSSLLASPTLSLKLTLEYDSNVFSLSDYDFDRFKDGNAFRYIETSDDFIQVINLRLRDTYRYKGLELSPFISPTYANYLQNSDKNAFSLLLGTTARWEKLTFNGVYGYYPHNYLRRFIDTDGTGLNEPFEYEKMMWRMTSAYRFNRYAIPLVYFKYEQYHHNKYFTEYDAPAYTMGLGWRALTGIINADVMYYYRTYQPKSDHQQIQYVIDNIKDGSYESNIYEVKLRTRRYYSTLTDYRFYTNFTYEDRYYQSQIALFIDSYHTTRNDKTTTINVGSDLWVARNLTLNFDFRYRFRNVTSDHPPVIRDKEYDKFQISSSVEWSFNLFK